MFNSKGYTLISIDLPTPPRSWLELDGEKMEQILRLQNSSANTDEFKLKVFLMMTGLVLRPESPGNDEDGNPVFLVRRSGRKHRREATEIRTWEVKYWIDTFCPYLDDPFGAFHSPYPDGLIIGGRHFKAPDGLLSSITYQQYGEVQRAMQDYWRCEERERKILEGLRRKMEYRPRYGIDYRMSTHPRLDMERTAARLDEIRREMRSSRNTFLAHLLVPRRKVWFEAVRSWLGEDHTDRYVYNSEVAEQMIPVMDLVSDEVFHVLYQQVQSALSHFRSDYPDIFRQSSRKDSSGKSELVIECDTVEAVKKYAQYPLAQDVYDENAVFIFSVLNSMAREAKMIEEQNQKIRMKK